MTARRWNVDLWTPSPWKWRCIRAAILIAVWTSQAFHASAAAPDNVPALGFKQAADERGAARTDIVSGGLIRVRGASYDGRDTLKAIFAGLATNKIRTLHLDIKVSNLEGFNRERLRDAILRLSIKDGVIREFLLAGTLGGAALRGRLDDEADGRTVVHIEADDAGALFRFINWFKRADRGRAWITMAGGQKDGAREASIYVEGLDLVDDPIVRVFGASVVSLRHPRSVRLSRLRLHLRFSENVISIIDGIIATPSVGATLAGTINHANNVLDIGGTAAPSFCSMRKVEPRREGMLAISYRMQGTLEAPVLRVDPFGPAGPNMLRKLQAFGWGAQIGGVTCSAPQSGGWRRRRPQPRYSSWQGEHHRRNGGSSGSARWS
jgi:hypothetical protein